MQQDFDQNKLEEEMRKRKERVEKWREEQRKKAIENIGEIKKELEEMKQGKKWSLEDDDGEKYFCTTLKCLFALSNIFSTSNQVETPIYHIHFTTWPDAKTEIL